jgi:hypothetical protein
MTERRDLVTLKHALAMEAGRLEGMAMMVDQGTFDQRALSKELREMAGRICSDRSQARAALEQVGSQASEHRVGSSQ